MLIGQKNGRHFSPLAHFPHSSGTPHESSIEFSVHLNEHVARMCAKCVIYWRSSLVTVTSQRHGRGNRGGSGGNLPPQLSSWGGAAPPTWVGWGSYFTVTWQYFCNFTKDETKKAARLWRAIWIYSHITVVSAVIIQRKLKTRRATPTSPVTSPRR